MNIFDKIYQRAKGKLKRIVLPEGDDLRVIQAAHQAVKENLAKVLLLGNSDEISRKAKKNNLDLKKIEIIDPRTDGKSEDYVQSYWNLRKHRGVTVEDARNLLLRDFVYFAAMMLRQGRVDGFVAGACHTTSNVAKAAFHCLEKDPRYSIASGSFLVQVKDPKYGEAGLFLFADCAIVPTPQEAQLAAIAVASAELWTKVTGFIPRLAMLSFSSRGSSSHPSVDKVRRATEIVRRLKPDLMVDGELQVDSAIVPEVAKIKVAQSPLAGRANILIFPSLDAGNIAYKLMQRLGRARVAGPIIQGLRQPCCDLSRGCSSREIVDAIALTCVRAQ